MGRSTPDTLMNLRRRCRPAMARRSRFFPISRYCVHMQVPPRRAISPKWSMTGAGLRIHTTVPALRPFDMLATRSHVCIAKEAEHSYPDIPGISKVHRIWWQACASRLSARRGNDDAHTRDTRHLAEGTALTIQSDALVRRQTEAVNSAHQMLQTNTRRSTRRQLPRRR